MTESKQKSRDRLRFIELEFRPGTGGRDGVEALMEWRGSPISGEARGVRTREGELRMGAHASLDVIRKMAGDVVEAELIGVKAVRAFDAWVVIASIRARAMGRDYRLLGAKAVDEETELARGAAISVLDALNRVLEKVVE